MLNGENGSWSGSKKCAISSRSGIALTGIFIASCGIMAVGTLFYFCMEDNEVWEQIMDFAPEATNTSISFLRNILQKFPQLHLPLRTRNTGVSNLPAQRVTENP